MRRKSKHRQPPMRQSQPFFHRNSKCQVSDSLFALFFFGGSHEIRALRQKRKNSLILEN